MLENIFLRPWYSYWTCRHSMTNSGANTDYCTISFMSLENRYAQRLWKSSVLARVKISTVRVEECYSNSQCGFPAPTGRTSHAIRRRLVSSRKLLHAPGSSEVSEEDRQTKTRQIQNSPEAVSLFVCLCSIAFRYMIIWKEYRYWKQTVNTQVHPCLGC